MPDSRRGLFYLMKKNLPHLLFGKLISTYLCVMEKEKQHKRPGRKTDRPVDRNRMFYLFVDQAGLSPAEVRAAVDLYLKKREVLQG